MYEGFLIAGSAFTKDAFFVSKILSQFLNFCAHHFIETDECIENIQLKKCLKRRRSKGKKKLKMLTLCQHTALFLSNQDIFPLSRHVISV